MRGARGNQAAYSSNVPPTHVGLPEEPQHNSEWWQGPGSLRGSFSLQDAHRQSHTERIPPQRGDRPQHRSGEDSLATLDQIPLQRRLLDVITLHPIPTSISSITLSTSHPTPHTCILRVIVVVIIFRQMALRIAATLHCQQELLEVVHVPGRRLGCHRQQPHHLVFLPSLVVLRRGNNLLSATKK